MGAIRSYRKLPEVIRHYLWLGFAVVIMAACQNDDNADSNLGNIVNVGDDVPAFMLTGANGENVSSASLRGQVYMLSFFDTGCSDCQKELPVLQRIYDKYAEAIPIFSVPRSQPTDEVKDYWNKEGLTMPVFTASDKALFYKFATSGIPRTYIVDEEGLVSAVLTDNPLADYDTIDGLLRNLLKEKASREGSTVELSIKTRASIFDAGQEKVYFKNEYIISHLELFFFDAETKKLAFKTAVKNPVQETNHPNTYYDITYIVPSIPIKVGVYNIYAIANYNNTSDNIENQEDFLNMIDSITYKEGIEANIPVEGPVMTSSPTALLSIDLVPLAGKSYNLMIEMERVLAKLQIGVAQNSFSLSHGGSKYADINITNYKLVNLNRQYYLFQHSYNDYIVDPLFYKKTTKVADALRFQNYYKSWFGNFTTEGFASMPTAGNYGYAYILENTAQKESQKNGYSPGIVFKGAVSPDMVYIYDNDSRRLVAEKRPEYWPDAIYLYKHTFYGSIQAINIAGHLKLDELERYTDSELKEYGIKQCKFNMGVYETYYTYWIRHNQDVVQHMDAMEYGIVRNNFYQMTVVGVSGIGNSEITPEIMRDNYPNSYEDIVVEE